MTTESEWAIEERAIERAAQIIAYMESPSIGMTRTEAAYAGMKAMLADYRAARQQEARQ